MYTVPLTMYDDLYIFSIQFFLSLLIYTTLIVSFFLYVRYTNLLVFCLVLFRLCGSIGLLCTEVKYLILPENKYTR